MEMETLIQEQYCIYDEVNELMIVLMVSFLQLFPLHEHYVVMVYHFFSSLVVKDLNFDSMVLLEDLLFLV